MILDADGNEIETPPHKHRFGHFNIPADARLVMAPVEVDEYRFVPDGHWTEKEDVKIRDTSAARASR